MGQRLIHSLLLGFDLVFDDEPLDLSSYLNGITKKQLLTSGAFLLSFNASNSKFSDNRYLLSIWFCKENNQFANDVYRKIQRLEKEYPDVSIINPLSSLQLFEHIFEMDFDHESGEEKQSNQNFEINLFKCYLLLNQINTSYDKTTNQSIQNVEADLKPAMLILTQQFHYTDITNYDIRDVIAAQIIKASFFFNFVSSHARTKNHLDKFLIHFDAVNWKDYLKKYLPIVNTILNLEKEAHTDITVERNAEFEKSCEFFDKLILEQNEELFEYDFVSLRSNPFYKVSEGVYRIIFKLFVIEKIFRWLYFFFSSINSQLPKKQKIKDFKSFYGFEFSEKFLFYGALRKCFPQGWLHFSGEDLDQAKMVGGPDYLLRNGNKVLIFENKDVLIKTDIKHSRAFNLLGPAFSEKFYFSEKDEAIDKKAVLQLVENIKYVLNLQIPLDQNYKPKRVKVYPIIIVHEKQFSTPGLNKLINHWFFVELKKLAKAGYSIQKIKPITVIQIDTFLLHQKLFEERKVRLEEMIDEYIKFTTYKKTQRFKDFEALKERYRQTLISFSDFFDYQIDERKIRALPDFFLELRDELFS